MNDETGDFTVTGRNGFFHCNYGDDGSVGTCKEQVLHFGWENDDYPAPTLEWYPESWEFAAVEEIDLKGENDAVEDGFEDLDDFFSEMFSL